MTLKAEIRKERDVEPARWVITLTDRNFFNKRSTYAVLHRTTWQAALRDALRAVGLS